MSHAPQPAATEPLQRLVGMIRDRTGNVIPPSRQPFLEEVAGRRTEAKGLSRLEDYVQALESDGLPGEWSHLIPLVTIKESYFFRAPQQWEVIRTQVLPELIQARVKGRPPRPLRIWSAACARGEEPATLAMILAEEKSLAQVSWSILATDVDEEALAGARLGLYGDRAIGQVPPELLERYFSRRGKLYELSAELRSRITYQSLNLAHPPFPIGDPPVDLVLLRNVLIYFRRPLQRRVVQQVGQHLARDGYLFLGASETLWQVQEELEAVDLGSCFCYRHRTKPLAPPPKREPLPPAPPESRPALRAPEPADPAVRIVVPRREAPPVPAPKAPVPQPLSVQESLLEAARHLAGNRVDEAGRAIGQVLAVDPSEPAAHALEGFLHDVTGRTDDAVASYRAALYLDPELYQVRVLLADCLLRLGNRGRAEHQYREVLAHLVNGRERNLVVFGELPFPDRTRAQRRCRQVLGGG